MTAAAALAVRVTGMIMMQVPGIVPPLANAVGQRGCRPRENIQPDDREQAETHPPGPERSRFRFLRQPTGEACQTVYQNHSGQALQQGSDRTHGNSTV